jgi:hypothetical protein
MARNGSGTYSLPAGNPVTTGTTISSSWANNTLSDISNALTASIAYDGQTVPIANLPMGGNKHTNVGNATVRTNYASAADVQDGSITYLTSVSGTNTILATGPVGMAAYATGQVFTFIAAGANTGATTININSIGAKAVVKLNGSALVAGDIPSGAMLSVSYDGTSFQLQTTLGVTSFSGGVTGLTPATATTGAVTLAGVLGKLNGGTGALTATITSVARTSSVSTITTSGNHGFVVGDYVTVAAVTNATFNGNFTITGTPTTTSFTYAQALGNVTATADTGTVTDLSYVNLTTNVTGILYPNFGGTGVATIPTGNLVVGNATSSVTTLAPSANGQSVIVTAGASVSMGSLVPGASYTITTVGTGNWTAIGASAATIGVTFTCNTTAQTGTGDATLNTFSTGSSIVTATSQATTSGTTITFSSIPSWAKRITVLFNGVSTSGSSEVQVRIGSGSIQATGYLSSSWQGSAGTTYSTGFGIDGSVSSTWLRTGQLVITNISGNIWIGSGVVARLPGSSDVVWALAGNVTLSGALDRLAITTANGTDTFDAGSINILYE